jgi:aminopeptidase N
VKSPLVAALLALVLVGGVASSCGDDNKKAKAAKPATSSATPTEPATPTGPATPTESTSPKPGKGNALNPAYKPAESRPVEDSVYPNVGDPGVDSLHYDLDLTWDPEASELTGKATVALRAAVTAPEFRLDFGEPLAVTSATVDGREVKTQHNGNNLVIASPVVADRKYLLVVDYAGTPEPTLAPTTRSDFSTTGWTITDTGEVWTMQEPYGAYTWYPVNDQPADKALYDFTITAPSPWVGVANGELMSTETVDGSTTTDWHLAAPASSYLVTIAIGDYVKTEDETDSGVPITYWTPRGDANALERMRFTPEAMAWLEKKLGPYPFPTLGSVVTDSQSAMETQTMVTYGNSDYTLSDEVIVHELCHQWYGDIVTPTDWRDVWMNEGMTMYLQGQFEADKFGQSINSIMNEWAVEEDGARASAGPPGDYDPRKFGDINIYFGPALMWHELRRKVGNKAFWAMVKKWPRVHAGGSATRAQFLGWVERETGKELSRFFDAWLMGAKTPARATG